MNFLKSQSGSCVAANGEYRTGSDLKYLHLYFEDEQKVLWVLKLYEGE